MVRAQRTQPDRPGQHWACRSGAWEEDQPCDAASLLVSWRASRWAVTTAAGSAPAKTVLLVLAEAADDSGYTFLGHDEIARRTELGKRTVVEHVQRLERVGLIRRQRRFNATDGSRASNGVFLQIEATGDTAQSADPAPRTGDQRAAPALRLEATQVHLTARPGAAQGPPRCGSRTLTGQEPT